MPFEPGQVISRRYLRGSWVTWVQPMRVISDDETGLLLWHPVGSDIARLVDVDGNTPHDIAVDRMRDPKLTLQSWTDYDVLVLMRPNVAHAVWWFFQEGVFAGWYVNLEAPYARRPDSVDTTDHVLDIVATPQRQWEWKDADEFDEHICNLLYFDSAAAAAIQAEGHRLIKLIEAGEFPFDGTHTGFRPDPDWPTLRLTGTPDFPSRRPA